MEAAGGAAVTLVFRIVNPAAVARTAMTHVEAPADWQVLFSSERLELPPRASLIDTVTLAPPRGAVAGDYTIRYEARLTPSEAPAAAAVTVRIGERRQLALAWLSTTTYLPASETGTFELLVTNAGNVTETVTLEVKSRLGSPLQTTWTHGEVPAGDSRRVRVVRPPSRATPQSVRDTLTATARMDRMTATTEANLGVDVVPEGRATDSRRSRLPTALAIRAGSRRDPGFGSFVGGGALDQHRSTTVDFGFLSREQSHPLMLERDRNYLNIKAPGWDLAVGDQTWSLSYLTEAGHYGRGAGGRLERRHWSAGAFVDMGRYDVTEGSQTGGFLGVSTGRVASVSVQYLTRFADSLPSNRVAEIGSVRVILKPLEHLTADVEAGTGRSATGTGQAGSGQVAFNSRRVSFYGRRVRRGDAYPIRDRTGLIDGAGLSVRPLGRLQFEGTFDGTGQLDDPTLPLDAPTRQRLTRATVSWGSLARVSAGRTEWTSPGRDWTAQWRRESMTAQMRIPLGPVWLAPGVEQGTEATPRYGETPYSLSWLHAGVRMGRHNSVDVRGEYGRGTGGDANRTVRRISFGATLQPVAATHLTLQVQNSASDALWLQGTRWINATLDQRLPWRHRIVATYQRRSGGTVFVGDDEAYRLDYVVPIGIPVRAAADTGKITVRLRDGESGQARARLLVQVDGQSRLTDRSGVVAFTGLKPGAHHITVAPGSVGQGRTVVPPLPIRVSVKGGGRVEVNATIVRTASLAGTIQVFQPASGGLSPLQGHTPALIPAAGVPGALIELVVNDEHRTAVADARGRFAFDGVPPGTWRVHVVRADVPAFFRLEQAEVMSTLAPGDAREIVFRVVPKSQ